MSIKHSPHLTQDWVKPIKEFGTAGLQLNLSLKQCQVLAEFTFHLLEAKRGEDFIYPDYIDKFFDVFKQFSPHFDENLFDNPYSTTNEETI